MKKILGMGCALLAAQLTLATEVSGVFGHHMVLQRDQPIRIWGKDEVGTQVTVEFGGKSATAMTDAKGNWIAELPAFPASTEERKLVVKGKSTITFDDVLVGDVWIVSGQSNAELKLTSDIFRSRDVYNEVGKYQTIRATKFKYAISEVPVTYKTTNERWWRINSDWTCTLFSAMGYFFARDLVKHHPDVPIGLLDNNKGGCPMCVYINRAGYALLGEQFVTRDEKRIKDRAAQLRKYADLMEQGTTEYPFEPTYYAASRQYYAMVSPIEKLSIKGVIWYQGESDEGNWNYKKELEAMIAGWRTVWGEQMPFYVVQLSSYQKSKNCYDNGGYSYLRDMQRRVCAETPHTGLAVIFDGGENDNIHPRNKWDVGERLARLVRHDLMGEKDLIPSGPLYKSMKIEGEKVRVSFDWAKGMFAGKKAFSDAGIDPKPVEGGKVTGFALAGADKKWFEAEAVIEGETIVLSSPSVKEPVAVRYGCCASPMDFCNLYNEAGLPASPFRTDDW